MNDLIITICRDTRKVKLNRGFIGLNGENLQGNVVVDFSDKAEFVDGTAFFEVVQHGDKYFIEMEKDAENKLYKLPIKSSLLMYAEIMPCQVRIDQAETEHGIPVFKSEKFNVPCLEAVNATEVITDQYATWRDELDEAIARANAVSADLEEKVATDYYRGEKGEQGEKGDMPDMSAYYTKAQTDASLAELENDIAVLNNALMQGGITYKADTEDTYNERITAEGLNVVDGSDAVLKKVVGNTVVYDKDENGLNGKLASASFGGIESTNADGTETSTLNFPKTPTPLGVTIDFENKKITDYGRTIVFTGNENWKLNDAALSSNYGNVYQFTMFSNEANYAASYICTDYEKADWNKSEFKDKTYCYGVLRPVILVKTDGVQTLEDFKAYLAQRYADGNPVTIRYVSYTLQSETPFTAEQSASGNKPKAYKGGTEKVLKNDGNEYGADNTLTQDYIVVKE